MFSHVTLIVFSLSCAGAQYGPPMGGPPGGPPQGGPPPPGGFAKMYNDCHKAEAAALAAMSNTAGTSGSMQPPPQMTPDIMKSKDQNRACYEIQQGVKALLGLVQFGPPPMMMMMMMGQTPNDTAMRRNDSIACPTTRSTIQQILQQGGGSGSFDSTCCDLACYCRDVSQSTSTASTTTTTCGGYFQPGPPPGFQVSYGQMPNGGLGFQASFGGPSQQGGQPPYYPQQGYTGTGTNQQPQMAGQGPQSMPYYPQANTGNVPSIPQMPTGQYSYQG